MKHYGSRKSKLFLFVLVLLAGYSCTQDEGIGGTSHISGNIVERVYNNDYSILLEEHPAKDEDVYLVFGDANVTGTDTKTSYTGNFEFNYLWPGNYKLYYYSKDSTIVNAGKSEKVIEIELKKNETTNLGELILISTKDWNEGSAVIKGKVRVTNYYNSSVWPNMQVKEFYDAQEQEVYISYGDHEFYDERIRTGYDGSFEFRNLIQGKYTIYVYSEDIKGGGAFVTVSKQVEIMEPEEVVTLGTLNIDKL